MNILFDEQISNHEDTLFYFEYIRRIKNVFRYFLHAIIIELSQQAHYLKKMAKYQDFLYSSSRITLMN